MARPPRLITVITIGTLIGCVVLLAQSVRPDELARTYAEQGLIGLLLKILAIVSTASVGAIYLLYRRVLSAHEEALRLSGKHTDVLLNVIRENTQALSQFRTATK